MKNVNWNKPIQVRNAHHGAVFPAKLLASDFTGKWIHVIHVKGANDLDQIFYVDPKTGLTNAHFLVVENVPEPVTTRWMIIWRGVPPGYDTETEARRVATTYSPSGATSPIAIVPLTYRPGDGL